MYLLMITYNEFDFYLAFQIPTFPYFSGRWKILYIRQDVSQH